MNYLEKMKWIITNDKFKKYPLRTLYRLISWEFIRLLKIKKKIIFDNNFKISLMFDEGISRLTYYWDYSEPEIFEFLDQYLKVGMIAIDIGSNIGLHSLFISKRIQPSGLVYSFEPFAKSYKRLKEIIQNNSIQNIKIFNMALGIDKSKGEPIEVINDSSKSFILPSVSSNNIKNSNFIEIVSLDSFVANYSITNIDFLKIDVEGMEFKVLLGGNITLREIIPKLILMEINSDALKRNGNNVLEILSYLNNLSYLIFELNIEKLKLQEFSGDPNLLPFNAFLIHKSNLQYLSRFIL